eukprot:TRINITY_DN27022_c0_g1_i1.p1 TRINITY_DN27022_c0_g1~~TRINITY_DN27022_c0_g1_i1.p1  ORF type:complete len:594 (-),score=92.36 TRINITY_DN27022_c0_g1_i1:188-1969(-)
MIEYEFGYWGVGFVWRVTGSVFPKSFVWAFPNAIFATVLSRLALWYYEEDMPYIGGSAFTAVWGGYTFILGFLLVFRTQIAYSRFWEGCSLLQQVKGTWMNAVSNLIAFSTRNPDRKGEVEAFQHLLCRLMSLLFCASLQQVADLEDDSFETLGTEGFDPEWLTHLAESEHKCEVILQWIQQLIVNNIETGVISMAPPIVSRVFQELSNGIIDVQGAKKIAEFLFPFPYAQSISFFLLMHWVITPWIACVLIQHPVATGVVTFATVFAVWSINYIAAEIEMPFGDDDNDLPISHLQLDFNETLRVIMHEHSKQAPPFFFDRGLHAALKPKGCRMSTRPCNSEVAEYRNSKLMKLGIETTGVLQSPFNSEAADEWERSEGIASGDSRTEERHATVEQAGLAASEKDDRETAAANSVVSHDGPPDRPATPSAPCSQQPKVGDADGSEVPPATDWWGTASPSRLPPDRMTPADSDSGLPAAGPPALQGAFGQRPISKWKGEGPRPPGGVDGVDARRDAPNGHHEDNEGPPDDPGRGFHAASDQGPEPSGVAHGGGPSEGSVPTTLKSQTLKMNDSFGALRAASAESARLNGSGYTL